MPQPSRLVGGGANRGSEGDNYLIPFYKGIISFSATQNVQMYSNSSYVQQMHLPKGMLLGQTSFRIPTHGQPGRVGYNWLRAVEFPINSAFVKTCTYEAAWMVHITQRDLCWTRGGFREGKDLLFGG